MNAEPPTARLQMEGQLRRPGYRKRSAAGSFAEEITRDTTRITKNAKSVATVRNCDAVVPNRSYCLFDISPRATLFDRRVCANENRVAIHCRKQRDNNCSGAEDLATQSGFVDLPISNDCCCKTGLVASVVARKANLLLYFQPKLRIDGCGT